MLKRGHILRTQEFDRRWVERLFERTDALKAKLNRKKGELRDPCHADKTVCLAFYEASTRTIGSFMRGAELLGLQVHNPGNMKSFSSAVKGETLEDTIRILCGQRPDIIVLRHDEAGAASRAAAVANDFERETGHQVYIINAGDGPGQHPSQSLLDLYTFREKFGPRGMENRKVVFGGDLRFGRVVRSDTYLLTKFGKPEFLFVSMPELALAPDIKEFLNQHSVPYREVSTLEEALELGSHYDAWYWTRSQSERIEDEAVKEKIKQQAPQYDLHPEHLERMGKDTIVLHPLPRINEIDRECDTDPRAWYFRQADNGMPIRMALYEYLLGVWE